MKNLVIIFIAFVGILFWSANLTMPADAARGTKGKGGASEKQLKELDTTVINLTKKYYTRELYSPKDSEDLINAKIMADIQMDTSPSPSLAPIYFKLGNLFKLREMQTEAIDSYQTILENFQDTVYAPKARKILTDMGVEIKENITVDEVEEEEEF